MTNDEILAIALKALKGGGGGGGASNYNDLSNLPQVNGVTLVGNKTSSDLGIDLAKMIADDFDDTLAYSEGDVVVHNNILCRFITDHAVGAWDDNEIEEIDVVELINEVKDTRYETITLSQAEYDALSQAEQNDPTKVYYIYDGQSASSGAVIDDNVIASDKLWSSQKISTEISQAGGASIDDTTIASNKVWSSSKVNTELGNKVTVVSGKGLSENDYTDADKTIVDGVTSALNGKVDKVAGKGLSTEDYTTAEQTKLASIEVDAEKNTIVSVSVNGVAVSIDANRNVDISALTKAVNDLQNYYLKTETYTKTEVDNLIGAISTITFEIVSTLPTTNIKTNVIYLVPSADPQTKNVKDEYINLDGTTSGWEQIGSTEIDLSGYLKTTDVGTAAYKDVPTSGDASATQVVLGTDSRLTDSRPASDVSAWAKAANKPTYTANEVGAIASTSAGAAGGVPTLDNNGLIPTSQIPSLSASDITDINNLIDD